MEKFVEAFKKDHAPVRVLVTGDVASEGVNLHAQCHELVHFDIPWSLMVFQQRNGRVDRYGRFLAYNVVGGVVWVTLLVWAGYLFGDIPIVRERFELVILGIIGVSVLPIVFEVVKGWKNRGQEIT